MRWVRGPSSNSGCECLLNPSLARHQPGGQCQVSRRSDLQPLGARVSMNIPVESILHCQILGNEAKGAEAPFLLHVFHACPHELMPGNTFYARVSGLRQEELNAGELEFLKLSLACTDIDTLLRREG